jgi:hypothetical protein
MTTPNDPVCATCNRPHGGDYTPRHPFRAKGSAVVLDPPKGRPQPELDVDGVLIGRARFPFDPVLRQALIDKGVLTVDDLRDAEAKIMVTTGQFQQAVRSAMMEGDNGDDGTASPIGGS